MKKIRKGSFHAAVAILAISASMTFAHAQLKTPTERLSELFWSSLDSGALAENQLVFTDSAHSVSTTMTFGQNGTCHFKDGHSGRWLLRETNLVIIDGSQELIFPVMTLRNSGDKISIQGRYAAETSKELVLSLEMAKESKGEEVVVNHASEEEDTSIYFGQPTNSP